MNDELGMRNEDDERGDEEILSSELRRIRNEK